MGSLISPYSVTGSGVMVVVAVAVGGWVGAGDSRFTRMHMHHPVRLSGIQATSGSSAVFIHLWPNERKPLQTWDN